MIVRKSVSSQYDDIKQKKNSFAEYIKIYAMLTLAGGRLWRWGIYVFVLPCSVVAGGIGGLSNILYYTFNIPVSIGSIALNAPLLIAALFKLKSPIQSGRFSPAWFIRR